MNTVDRNIESILKKVPQYTRFKRHAFSLLLHTTPKKLINLVAVELERKMRRTRVWGFPYYLIVDSGNICNLKCPLCPTGNRTLDRNQRFVRFEDFRRIIDKLYLYAYEVSLYNWGEPFLNPDIFQMIRYCVERNISTNLSSNFNISDLDSEEVIKSGLEYLSISLDGTTQEVYSKYRVGGKIDLVFQNLKKILKKKKDFRSRTPFIEWQFIVMKQNCHQIDDARRMAKEMGVDIIRFIPVGVPMDAKNKKELASEWFPDLRAHGGKHEITDRFLQKPIKGGCFYLYRSVTIHPGGAVAPCCVVYKEKDDFGNMFDTDFSQIWNNESYQSARSLFSRKQKSSIKTVCNRCPMFSKP